MCGGKAYTLISAFAAVLTSVSLVLVSSLRDRQTQIEKKIRIQLTDRKVTKQKVKQITIEERRRQSRKPLKSRGKKQRSKARRKRRRKKEKEEEEGEVRRESTSCKMARERRMQVGTRDGKEQLAASS